MTAAAAGLPAKVTDELAEAVEGLELVDHHVHGALRDAPDRAAYGNAINEADTAPLADDVEPFDSQIGFALRAWCAPVLELPRHAHADAYWERRAELGEAEVNRRFLTAAGVSDWFVDTGLQAGRLLDPAEMGAVSGRGHEIVRLETLAETLATEGVSAVDYPDAFRALLEQRTAQSLGTKSILAYRCGFDVDLRRPDDAAVRAAYDGWRRADKAAIPRVADPTLIAFGIHEAVARGLPVQLHVGLGDRDMDLALSNPLLLTDFLRLPEVRGGSFLLLHCYPFEREAGYLAQGFDNVYLDVGLSLNYLGGRGASLVARALELAPFHKLLYSSDAYGPADLHYLGARLWRTSLVRVLGEFVAADEWSPSDAVRIARMISRDNVSRAYPRAARHLVANAHPHPTRRAVAHTPHQEDVS